MRYCLFFLVVLAITPVLAQEPVTYYTNVNSELCFELYRTGDGLGAYRAYVVIDEETTFLADTVLFNHWHGLSRGRRSAITQRWSIEGRRIEVERAPYITRPPHFPNRGRVVLHVVPNTAMDWTVWEGARESWQYRERPF